MRKHALHLLMALLALSPLATLAADRTPVAGTDYEVIEGGKPFAAAKGKIEVAEVFSYACVHCAHFEPTLRAWQRKQPADVQLTAVPAALMQAWVPFARAYYAAEASGLLPKTHEAMFKALHENGTLPIRNVSVEELTTFYAGYGADRAKFDALLRSDAIGAKVERARQFAMDSGVAGTPMLIVAGKYRITGGDSYEDMLRIVDWLVARERKTKK